MKLMTVEYAETAGALTGILPGIDPLYDLNSQIWPCPSGRLIEELYRFQPDLLITVDLAGFELTTLCRKLFYNRLDCKCLHLLMKRNLPGEYLLANPLSMSMFFFCQGRDYYEHLKNAYPDIPFLRAVEFSGNAFFPRSAASAEGKGRSVPAGMSAVSGAEKTDRPFMPDQAVLTDIFRRVQEETGLPLLPRG